MIFPAATFLAARYDEDEAAARSKTDNRALLDIEAKRRILAAYLRAEAPDPRGATNMMIIRGTALRQVVMTLTLPYADHPDFDRRWRPLPIDPA